MPQRKIDLDTIFDVLKHAYNLGCLDLKAFETDYIIRYSFSISKYQKSLYEEENNATPDANSQRLDDGMLQSYSQEGPC